MKDQWENIATSNRQMQKGGDKIINKPILDRVGIRQSTNKDFLTNKNH